MAQVVLKPGVKGTYLLANSSERAIKTFLGRKVTRNPSHGWTAEVLRAKMVLWVSMDTHAQTTTLVTGQSMSCDWRTWQWHACAERGLEGYLGSDKKDCTGPLGSCSSWQKYSTQAQSLFNSLMFTCILRKHVTHTNNHSGIVQIYK